VPAGVADSVSTEAVAPGVWLHRLVSLRQPWRAYVLDVDLAACVSLRAVKGAPTAVGRATTSALLTGLPASERAIAAVNADFFLFAPPGVPTNAHVERGRVVSGPGDRPVFAMLADGRPFIGTLAVRGAIETSRGTIPLITWNRPTRGRAGVVDAAWGVPLDTAVGETVWRLAPVRGAADRHVATAALRGNARVAAGDTLVAVEVPGNALRSGDTVRVTRALTPLVREAVGDEPREAADSVILGAVDSVSNAGFRGLNPRTALGLAANGRRALLAVIDGRQAGYSAGMSLRETASLLRDLGAREAVNLDGGGSSALVILEGPEGARRPRVINRPSDAAGERPVANALAVTGTCAGR
jgi:hypothetical protein